MTFKIKTQIKLWIWRIVTPLLMNHQSPVYFRNCVSGVWGSPNGINDPVWEGKKKKNTKTAAVSHNTLYRTWASLHHQTAFDQKKKQKTKGVIRFTFLDSLLYLWNDQFGARRTEPETYFFAQPSWSNMIFFAASYVNVTIFIGLCGKMWILFMWEYVRGHVCPLLRLSLMKLVQNILCRFYLEGQNVKAAECL